MHNQAADMPLPLQQQDHGVNSFAAFFWMLPQEYVLESSFYVILCWLLGLVSHMYLKYELCPKSLESLWNRSTPRKFHLASPRVISVHQLWKRDSGFWVLTGCNFWHFQTVLGKKKSPDLCMFFLRWSAKKSGLYSCFVALTRHLNYAWEVINI